MCSRFSTRFLPRTPVVASGWIVVAGLVLASGAGFSAEPVGIAAPEGFEVTQFADDSLAHDVFSMTVDAQGRIVVAGPGYVKTLHDEDGDGRAERATVFSEVPGAGAKGMVFVGDDLICTGDNAVMRLSDADGDGRADGPPQIWARLRNPEHGANGMVQGPDGWIYLICGNDAGLDADFITEPRSPIRDPQSGAVLRFSPDGSRREIVAHGFRNPYDLDFNERGHLFTVDSDGERDQHLPWYSPTRLFDIAPGMHHGWVLKGWQRSWNRPGWFPDTPPRLVEIGRGSPTGVLVYRHHRFPERYHNGLLSCCWTLGRVYHFPLQPAESSYASEAEVFLQTTGDVGFAPVDLVVDPQGDLFVAIGGRGTRGGVFRVRYRGPDATSEVDRLPLREVLLADQPLAAWSRAEWVPLARWFGAPAFQEVLNDDLRTPAEKVRAIEILTELFDGLAVPLAESVAAQSDLLAARVAWSLGRRPQGADGARLLARLTHSADPQTQRAAWESLATVERPPLRDLEVDWSDPSAPSDRRLRLAASQAEAAVADDAPPASLPPLAQLWRKHLRGELSSADFGVAAEIFATEDTPEARLQAVRLMQLALGDVLAQSERPEDFAGYQANASAEQITAARDTAGTSLAAAFPTGNRDLDRELVRLLAMLSVDDSELVSRLAARLAGDDLNAVEDVRYLMVLARLPGARDEAARGQIATAILALPDKLDREGRFPSRNWPLRIGETFDALCRHDAELPAAMIDHDAFGAPGQALFVLRMPPALQARAARRLIDATYQLDDEEAWTEDLAAVAALLPAEEMLPVARDLWESYRLRERAVEMLAPYATEEDHGRLVASLSSVQPATVVAAAEALARLSAEHQAPDVLAAVRALRQACADPQQGDSRAALVKLLRHWTNADLDDFEISVNETSANDPTANDPAVRYAPWFAWFVDQYPEQAAQLAAFGNLDAAAWRERLAAIDWEAGETERGREAFEKRSCVRCHAGNARLGPDLAGAAGRFSRDDLFAAIVDPNKDVSPLYHTTQVVTGSGKVYHGTLVYASPDGTLLQTSPDSTIRIAGEEIVSMQKSARSLMPAGLLNEATDQELADLYAYLRSLQKAQ